MSLVITIIATILLFAIDMSQQKNFWVHSVDGHISATCANGHNNTGPRFLYFLVDVTVVVLLYQSFIAYVFVYFFFLS